jgi:surfactin synthase thioesterase subunit
MPNPNARIRLFCFHHAGGAASAFRAWPKGLPAGWEVCPVQLPGRENLFTQARFTALAPLLDALCPALRAWIDRPFALFGHSLGALVAFEAARRLRQSGRVPTRLFLAAHRAPHLPAAREPLARAPDAVLLGTLCRLGGMPEAVLQNEELLQLLLPVFRDDLAIAEDYRWQGGPPLDCPISVLGGQEDPFVDPAALQGWGQHTRGGCRTHRFPGGHFFVRERLADVLGAIVHDLAGSPG